ncbi:MAG TPA: hypothetical protein VGF64_17005 [Acidimicrobiales bacterium]
MRTIEFTFSQQSVGRIASALHLSIRDHTLALPDDAALLDELANVRLRETSPGVLRMDHDPDRHDDRAVALALACHWLLEHGQRKGPRMHFNGPHNNWGAAQPDESEPGRHDPLVAPAYPTRLDPTIVH